MTNEITITAEQVQKMQRELKHQYKRNEKACQRGNDIAIAESREAIFTIERMFDIMGIEY